MKPVLTALAGALFAAVLAVDSAAGQQTFVLPLSVGNPLNTNVPFAVGRMRYQQWYSAAQWQARSARPIRVNAMQFRAGSSGLGVAGRQVEIEVTMANGPTTPSSAFESNLVSGRVIVFPRNRITLPAPTPGTWPVTIPFTNEFVWNGTSSVVVDIRVWDNGNNGNSWTYDMEYDGSSSSAMFRLWAVNNPTATTAGFMGQGQGLTTRFFYNSALSISYGTGCAGEGGFVPLASTEGGLPVPGNGAWTQVLSRAPSQRQALFYMGFSSTLWNGQPLPFDLGILGAAGCSVLAEVVAGVTLTTVGGGPGAGIARLPFPMPSTTSWVGIEVFSQWIVIDPGSPSGVLCVSNGLWHITASS